MVRKERVTTTLDLKMYNLATENNIPFASALEHGIKMLVEGKGEAYQILEGRIDHLEGLLDRLEENILENSTELREHKHE